MTLSYDTKIVTHREQRFMMGHDIFTIYVLSINFPHFFSLPNHSHLKVGLLRDYVTMSYIVS